MRLLAFIDADEALRARLVVAYVPGFKLPMSLFKTHLTHLEPCTHPTQTGCVAAWDTYKEGATVQVDEPLLHWAGDRLERVAATDPRLCVNPITWRLDGEPSEREAHLGAVEMRNEGEPISFPRLMVFDEPLGVDITGLEAPRAHLLSAQCVKGVLRVPDLDELDYPEQETEAGNYHLLDYELFFMDIRANAIARTTAWLAQGHPPTPAL